MSEAAGETDEETDATKGIVCDGENGNGLITKDEFQKVFDFIGARSDEEVDELFAVADTTGDGKMSYEEFLELGFEKGEDQDNVAYVLGECFFEGESCCEDGEAACRICLLGEQVNEPLLRLCRCDGNARWAHAACIATWLQLNPDKPCSCEVCGQDLDATLGVEGQPPDFKYLSSELDGPELEGHSLSRVLFIIMGWMFLVGCVEGTRFALNLLPLQILSKHGCFVMITDMVHLRLYILILGGAVWQPKDWGAFVAWWTERVFEAIKVFFFIFGVGIQKMLAVVAVVSVHTIYKVLSDHHDLRNHPYSFWPTELLSSAINLISLAWLLNRAFLDQRPLVS